MIRFVTPRRGKPPRAIAVTDLADFYVCPRRFLYRKVFGQKPSYAMIRGAREHAKKYSEHKTVADRRMELGLAVDVAMAGEELVGREVEVFGNGLYGIIDEVRLYPEEAVIIDFKSSLSERGKLQVLAYASALSTYGYRKITARITRIRDEEVLWEKEFSEGDHWLVESLKQRFYSTVRTGVFPRKESPDTCRSCPFVKICGG